MQMQSKAKQRKFRRRHKLYAHQATRNIIRTKCTLSI